MDTINVDETTYNLIKNIYDPANFTDPRIIHHATKPSDVIGYPVMFYEYTDPSFKYSGGSTSRRFGRVEYNTLVKDMPLIFIQPGKPKYLPSKSLITTLTGADTNNKEAVYNALQKIAETSDGDEAIQAIKQVENGTGMKYDSRYYGFKPAYDEYIKFLNSMSAYVLLRMRLHNSDFRMSGMHHTDKFLQKTMIPIYADTSTTKFSESGQNSTTESMLAGMVKNAGSLSREIDFLFNGQINRQNATFNAEQSNLVSEKLGGLAEDLGVKGPIDHLLSAGKTVINGGNLIFPEIWQDSSYSKSYDIGLKLYSPYGDPLSIYNNIYHPLLCLLTLTLPRSLSKQGYAAPFLVKVFSKGWFSCDMGMVESISITKGGASGKEWTDDGYPLAVDVTLTIKDLYPTVMQTLGKAADIYSFNTGMTEFLETLAAVEPGEIDYFLRIKSNMFDSFFGLGNTFAQRLSASIAQSGVSNSIYNIVGAVADIGDGADFILTQISGVLSDVNNLFTSTNKDLSTSEDITGNGNYSDVDIEIEENPSTETSSLFQINGDDLLIPKKI